MLLLGGMQGCMRGQRWHAMQLHIEECTSLYEFSAHLHACISMAHVLVWVECKKQVVVLETSCHVRMHPTIFIRLVPNFNELLCSQRGGMACLL
jgi:hypothetical protein